MCSSLVSSCSSSEAAIGDVLKKGVLKNSAKFTETLMLESFSLLFFFPCALWGDVVGMDPSVNFRWPFAVK